MRSDDFRRHNSGDVAHVRNDIEAGTPVVFLHGFSDMAECWLPLIERLDLDLPMYALDAPAHGHSPFESRADFTTQLVDRAVEFIRSLGRPAILMGHSMGALESMYIAGDAPEAVRAIVLEDPPMAQDLTPWEPEHAEARLFDSLAALAALGEEGLVAKARASTPHWDEGEFLPWARSKVLLDVSMRSRFVIHREPMERTLASIACPVLLITGDPKLGSIVTADTAAWARTLCPSLRVAHFPGTGHSVHRDAPAAVADAVRSFILEQS